MTVAHINGIGTAVPPHDVHAAFVDFARTLLDDKGRFVFDRMAERSGIAHRFSFFEPGLPGAVDVDAGGFYRRGAFPGTAARMEAYAAQAVELAIELANTERSDPEWARDFLGSHEDWFTAGTSFDLSPGETHRAAATAELVRSVALAESRAELDTLIVNPVALGDEDAGIVRDRLAALFGGAS